MDPKSDEQTELLRNIWNEMKALGQNLGKRIDRTNERLEAVGKELGARIDDTNARLDQTNARLDQTNARLGSVEEVLRDLAGQQVILTRYVKHSVERHDDAITDLRERMVRVETELAIKR